MQSLSIFPQLLPLVLLILLFASILHWRRTRQPTQWLFMAALCLMLAGVVTQYLGVAPLRGRTPADIRSGEAQPDQEYLKLSKLWTNLALVLAALGGLNVILASIRSKDAPQARRAVTRTGPSETPQSSTGEAAANTEINPYEPPAEVVPDARI